MRHQTTWVVFAGVLIAAFSASVALLQAANSTSFANRQTSRVGLTVEEVIALVRGGLSEELIIAKIRQNSKPFDLSAAELLRLKKEGVSDNIIRVMLDPKAETTLVRSNAKAVQTPRGAAESASTPSATISPNPAVQEVGFYLLEGNQVVQIAATGFSRQKVSGLSTLKMAATAGIAKIRQKAVIRGSAAAVRTTNKNPQFVFYAPEGFSPADYLAIRLERKSNSREVGVGSVGITGASGGFEDKDLVRFSTARLAPRKFLVKFEQALLPGEYCFYPASALHASETGVNVSGRLYDFGIDH